MKPFRSSGGKTYKLRLYTAAGVPVDRTAGTRDLSTAKAMARSVERVKEKKAYAAIYEALLTKRLDIEEVWLADERGELDQILERLNDVDLEPLVTTWHKGLKGKVVDDTRDHYEHAVRTLIEDGKPFTRSTFTIDALQTWVDEMEGVEPGTVRKRGMGMRRFAEFLFRVKRLLPLNPMLHVELPPAGAPLDRHIDTEDVERLADATPGQMRLLQYALPGTAMEVTTALAIRVRDVSRFDKTVHAPGTKTHNRNRIVRVAAYAWPAVLEALKGKHPDTRVFDHIADRWRARDLHVETRDGLIDKGWTVYRDYTLRDHRHTWAVRAVRAGMPLEMVARQLGHKDGTLALKVYGRYRPAKEEVDRWEDIATEHDEKRRAAK